MKGGFWTWTKPFHLPLLLLIASQTSTLVIAAPTPEDSNTCKAITLPPPGQNKSYPNLPTVQGDSGDDYPETGTPSARRSIAAREATLLRKRVAPLESDEWQLAVQGGRTLWNDLQKALSQPPDQDPPECSIAENWDILYNPDIAWKISKDFNDMISEPMPDESFYRVEMVMPKLGPDDLSLLHVPEFIYTNHFSPQYNTILAEWNYSNKLESTGKRAPDRWSDVTFAFWKSVCAEHGTDPADLRYILRQCITNMQTQQTIASIFKRPEYQDAVQDGGAFTTITVMPGDEAFMALLRTPNVIGTVYMLKTYVNGLRRKTIKRIVARQLPATNLVIELEDYVQASTVETA